MYSNRIEKKHIKDKHVHVHITDWIIGTCTIILFVYLVEKICPNTPVQPS